MGVKAEGLLQCSPWEGEKQAVGLQWGEMGVVHSCLAPASPSAWLTWALLLP